MNNKLIRDTCIVCSGTGEHDIWNRIPIFVHANPKEFRYWPKTIVEMLEDVCGIMVERNNSWPQKICAVCISFMKHAIMFRNQVMNNIMFIRSGGRKMSVLNNLTAAVAYNRGDGFEEIDSVNDNGFDYDIGAALFAEETFDDLKHELDTAYGGPYESDEEDDADGDGIDLFSYKEKRFTEDDALDDIGDGCGGKILITEPDEKMRERKCDACRKRFMLKESFEQHLKECIELKLLTFITEGYQLVSIRRSRSLSSHEFVRRNIFSLKKLIKSLALCYKEVTDVTVTTDDIANVLNKNSKLDDLLLNENNIINFHSIKENLNNATESMSNIDGGNSLNCLQGKQNVLIKKNQLQKPIIPHTTIFERINNESNGTVIDNGGGTENSTSYQASKNLLQTFVTGGKQNSRAQQSSSPIGTVVAMCSPCGQSFTSLGLFEEHNRQHHNTACSTPSIVSNVSTTPSPPELLNISAIPRTTPSIDILDVEERNTLLERLAARPINY